MKKIEQSISSCIDFIKKESVTAIKSPKDYLIDESQDDRQYIFYMSVNDNLRAYAALVWGICDACCQQDGHEIGETGLVFLATWAAFTESIPESFLARDKAMECQNQIAQISSDPSLKIWINVGGTAFGHGNFDHLPNGFWTIVSDMELSRLSSLVRTGVNDSGVTPEKPIMPVVCLVITVIVTIVVISVL